MTNQAVFFEIRSSIRLGAEIGGGERRVVLIDTEGEEHKLSRRKVLYTLAQRVTPEPPALRAARAALLEGAEPFDPDLLWRHLEDGPRYDLADLARVYFDRVDDVTVAQLVEGLSPGGARVVDCIRLRKGYLQRLDAESLAKLREARAREAAEQAADDAFLAWFTPLQAAPPPTGAPKPEAPPAHAERLAALVDYALRDGKSSHARTGRRLGRRLELADADAVLAELERVRLLPAHTNALPYRHGVPVEFRKAAREAAQALRDQPPPLQGEDLRDLPTIAIDDPFTQDVDDAISAWERDGELHLAVHIAHVAHAVQPRDPLDAEARRRGSSLYFPDGTVPMLPLALSADALSLQPGEPRRAVSLLARVGADGLPTDVRFVESIVSVDARLTYEETGSASAQAITQRLAPVAKALRAARVERGALVLALPQVKLRVGADGAPQLVPLRQDLPSHVLVSELMVLYNAELGACLARGGAPALFRVQPRAITAIDADPADPLYPLTSRRGLPPTVIAVEPGPHRTLGLEHYVQGTSPIRRYGDLVAQRQLLCLLQGVAPRHGADDIAALRQSLERCERRARTLEDERERYWLVAWLRAHPEPLAAFVSRVEGRRRLVYVPALRRELPCALPDDAQPGQALRVVPQRWSPRRLTFAPVDTAPTD